MADNIAASRYLLPEPTFAVYPETRPIPPSMPAVIMALRRWHQVGRTVAEWCREIEGLQATYPQLRPPAPRTVYTILTELSARGIVHRIVDHRRGRRCRVFFRLSGMPIDRRLAERLVASIYALGMSLPENIGPMMPGGVDEWPDLVSRLPPSLRPRTGTARTGERA